MRSWIFLLSAARHLQLGNAHAEHAVLERRCGRARRQPERVLEGAIVALGEEIGLTLLLSAQTYDGTVELAAGGAWTAPNAAELDRLVHSVGSESEQAKTIDMRGVEQFDTYGAVLLERLCRASQAQGRNVRIVGPEERYRWLLREVHRLNPATPEAKADGMPIRGNSTPCGR